MAEEIKVRIDWESDENELAAFANHLIATFDGNMYTLRFYQVLPPAVAADPEAVRKLTSVKGRHVGSIVVSAASMPNIVEALQGLLTRQAQNDKE